MLAILAVVIVFIILVLAEYLSRYKGLHSELSRKLVHIAVGAFVAFWPFFLSWRQIQLLSLAFLAVILLSIKFNIFQAIHAVKRNVAGEVLFAISIGILALISTTPWVFTAAMLFLSVADGMAAVVGVLWGDDNTYKVFGHKKSIAGSLAFFFSGLSIMLLYTVFGHAPYSALTLLGLPIIATVAENVAVQGTDNLVIPLLVGLVLTSSL